MNPNPKVGQWYSIPVALSYPPIEKYCVFLGYFMVASPPPTRAFYGENRYLVVTPNGYEIESLQTFLQEANPPDWAVEQYNNWKVANL